jgi:hypothetical protein
MVVELKIFAIFTKSQVFAQQVLAVDWLKTRLLINLKIFTVATRPNGAERTYWGHQVQL